MSEAAKAQIDSLAAFPDQLKRQLQGLEEAALRFRPAPNEWSILEIVGHMNDVGALWPARIRQMLATDNPTLAAVDPDWVRQRDYHNKQLSFLLLTLAEQRAEFVEFVRVLRPAQLARPGLHPTRGPLTVEQGIAALADHDRIHSQQIAANLEAYRSTS
ncbi:MAG TPA: DinB family protein [Roseiflexaceae bacterium]|nr:DinB family protein [Roseiflexaceae bacterium]